MKRIAFCMLMLALWMSTSINAQQQIGLRTDNYGGINSVLLNPAAYSSTPFHWDVNIVEGAFFLQNNYAYILQTNLPDLLRDTETLDFQLANEVAEDLPLNERTRLIDFYSGSGNRYLNLNISLMGPSFYVHLNENHAFGMYTRFRTMATTRDISNNFSYYTFFNQPFDESFEVPAFQLAIASWSEIALNYMHTRETANGIFSVGLTAKYLQAYEGVFLRSDQTTSFTKLQGDQLVADEPLLALGYTNGNLEDNNRQLARNGQGVAFDIGFQYLIGERGAAGYDWKIGFSLMDLGSLNYNQNAQYHEINLDQAATLSTEPYESIQGVEEFDVLVNTFNEQLTGDSVGTVQGDQFTIGLPTAFNIHVDKAITENIYVAAVYSQGVPLSKNALNRGSLLAVNPRFETRWFGWSLPVSVYNWDKFQVGMGIRAGFLYLGTDNLLSLAGKGNFSGTDFYFALKVNPFNLGGGKDKNKSPRMRGPGGKGIKCYRF